MITSKAPTELVDILRPWFIEGWVPIAQSTLTGTAASVTFSSIPDDFRTLVLVCQLRTDRVAELDSVHLRFNGDSGNNYDRYQVFFNAGATTYSPSRGISAIQSLWICEAASSRASNFSAGITYLPGYKQTDRDKWAIAGLSEAYGDVSADNDMYLRYGSGRWRNNNAITSITILPDIGPNFVADCVLQLYGIR